MANAEKFNASIAWLPDLIYTGGRFERGRALVCDASGTIVRLARIQELRDEKQIRLANRAMLPSMVNAHSHAFQRVLRGRTEYRTSARDSFWTWREMMYSAATRLTPEDVYDASRMAFLEMALSGIAAVGEFHYLHHAPDGKPYDDPNQLAKEVIRAAGDVGLRIALLRVAYVRSGFRACPNPQQVRFIEADADVYLQNLEVLANSVRSPTVREGDFPQQALADARASAMSWTGVAPHSVRAVPLEYLREVIGHAKELNLRVHMHVAEQPAEVSACVEEYGRTPIALLETEGLLSERFTAVHAIHVTPKAMPAFAKTGATVCACPTTERNLGDGVVPADEYLRHGVPICLGTDSHVQIDPFEEARELEYHLRLQKIERAVLGARTPSSADVAQSELAALLFDCATVNGARSIGSPNGTLDVGKPADFFTVDLSDPSIAGASPDDLLSSIMFSASRAAVREVAVGGKPIVSDGQHLIQEEVVERFGELQKRLWG
ncbi:MAG TPA: formimidoylglutamate deiminase [Pyrinomonadaceae bacterium]|nr:formimidoylglutamate deiminase [Pyrinomonadaceae bacterium]